MMNPAINFLKNTFEEEDFYLAIRAFRENNYIWDTLQNDEHLKLIHKTLGSDLSLWTPANIAIITMGFSDIFKDIANHSIIQNPEIRYKSATTLELLSSEIKPKESIYDLEFACLAALGIRERWLILDEADSAALFDTISTHVPIWLTIGTLLFGMVPNPIRLITTLLQSDNPIFNSTAIQAVIAQPASQEHQLEMLYPGLQKLSPYHRSSLLIELNQRYPDLAQKIAETILNNSIPAEIETLDPYQQILHYIEKAELLKITKQFDQAMPTLEHIWDTTTRLQAGLAAQLAQAAVKGKDQKTATEAIRKVNKFESLIKNEASPNEKTIEQINLGNLPLMASTQKSDESNSEAAANAAALLSKAKHAYKNNQIEAAQALTQQAYQIIIKTTESQNQGIKNLLKFYQPDYILTVIELLLATKLLPEAQYLATTAKALLPNNSEFIWLSSKIEKQSGNFDQALENAYIAVALAPDKSEYQKHLVSILIELGKYQEAVLSSERYFAKISSPTMEDYQLVAECTYRANELKKSEQYCQKGIAQDPKNSDLLILLGKVKAQNEEIENAISIFNQAILASPNMIEPWLELANLHLKNHEPEKALEKLTSAAEINPQDPIIFLEIGKIYFMQQNTAKAIEILNQSLRLVSQETKYTTKKEIHLVLGQALIQAGYLDDAKNLLESAHTVHPTDEEIAHLYGKTLLNTQEYEKAINALEIPIQAGTSQNSIYLDYASALLELKIKTSKAVSYIELVLENDPENERAKILKAHATANSGNHKLAIQLYQQALETNLGNSPEYFAKLISGIAKSAYEDNKPEVAITFLKEALQKLPDNLSLQKLLCQALTLADLSQDAYCLLTEIYENNNHDLDLLLWISDQAIALCELEFSENILKQAIQMAPQKAEVIVRLGYIQLETGQEELARQTFEKLFSAENADTKDLKMAAHALISLGDFSSSIPYIEKALEKCDYQSSDLLEELTNLHLKSEQYQPAMNTIQKHLKLDKKNPGLWLKRSEIYQKLNQPNDALTTLFEALKFVPNSAAIHEKAAGLLRKNHDLQSSLHHINEAIKLENNNPTYLLQAAEIHHACLMPGSAAKIIESVDTTPNTLSALLLKAEIHLENTAKMNLQSVKTLIEKAENLASTNPRLLAVKSRIYAAENNLTKAKQVFDKAKVNYDAYNKDELSPLDKSTTLLSIAQAALALKEWDTAISMSIEASKTTPTEPRPKYFLAKVHTLRAEHQQNCLSVKCTTHAPGQEALSANAVKAFQKAIKELAPFASISNETKRNIARWENRGSWAFNINLPAEDEILHDHEDFAAYLAANRRAGKQEIPVQKSNQWLGEPIVKFQLSLASSITDLNHAIQLAAETLSAPSLKPLNLANYAFIANRLGENKEANKAIVQALEIWSDEPAWHALAAKIHKELGNTEQLITHLEYAAKLDAENPKLLHDLALTYLGNNMPGHAIRFLENAIKINPLAPEFWSDLAKAQLQTEEFEQARESIEKAIDIDSSSLSPLLVAVEIAQKQKDYVKANKFLNQAIALAPKDSHEIISLSNLLVNQKRSKEALELLDEHINQSSSPITLILQKANVLGKIKGARSKQDFLMQLVKENKKNPEIFAHLAFSYIENGQHAEAIRTGQYALKQAENSLPTSIKSKLHLEIGKLLHQSGQLDQAIHHLSQTIKHTPGCIEAYLQIGETLQLRREYQKAMEYLNKASAISPADPRPLVSAGLLSKESKDYSQAEKYLRRAASLAPKDINIQRQLAQVIALALIHQPLHEKV